MDSISLTGLSIGYRIKGGEKIVADCIDVSLHGGELTCLIGSNGAGKSTLLKTLAGFLPKLGGHVHIKGREISEYTQKELSRLISVVLTSRLEVLNITVEEVVALGRSPYTGFWGTLGDEDKRIVRESMDRVGISHLAARTVSTLSDGERQKMMIAKALAQQTPVIFLDEPTAFLDYPSKVETMLLLSRLSHDMGKTIFMSTHDLELALQTADMLWLMPGDGSVDTGTPRQLADSGALSAFIERSGITFDKDTLRITVADNVSRCRTTRYDRRCKRLPFALQKTAFRIVKGYLSQCKR